MAKKIQLNDEQWAKLLTLAGLAGTAANIESRKLCGRLSSHGLVSLDRTGREYLTERGMHRLSQGR
ncbi:hypothetical protein [Variovorax saccharolyticus]|uniref:hypothetical protein n=1 Tax=Variovorax saccharolyticus TaxID=3053516 RepID=UPI00257574CD|nr:hypothetical protein [Variovorax sp. J22R187]MDM0020980.1 hypothetical protein [Variovorax sp. J22R187]